MDFIDRAIKDEGGWSDHPADRGGKTKYGITLKTFRYYLGTGKTEEDLRNLTKEGAKDFYKIFYWERTPLPQLPKELHAFAFDMNVNHGQGNAVKIIQNAAIAKGSTITADGVLGPKTIEAAKTLTVNDLILQRIKFYSNIVSLDKTQLVFLNGWIIRALSYRK